MLWLYFVIQAAFQSSIHQQFYFEGKFLSENFELQSLLSCKRWVSLRIPWFDENSFDFWKSTKSHLWKHTSLKLEVVMRFSANYEAYKSGNWNFITLKNLQFVKGYSRNFSSFACALLKFYCSKLIKESSLHNRILIQIRLCFRDLLKRRDKITSLIKRVQRLITLTLISLLISAPYRDSRAVISGKCEIYRLDGIGAVEKHPERLESVLINVVLTFFSQLIGLRTRALTNLHARVGRL